MDIENDNQRQSKQLQLDLLISGNTVPLQQHIIALKQHIITLQQHIIALQKHTVSL